MPERTETTWTCSRCGAIETLPGTDQPKDWTRVGFVNPPKASWGDKLTILGDLCNGPRCGGLLVAFMHGEELSEAMRIDEMEAAMARIGATS